MELRHMKYFREVCRLGSITKAAEELHISQPSLTVAIQSLEEMLGVTLFERNHRQISLTTGGELFLQYTNDILLRTENAIAAMQDYRRKKEGVIRIGIPPMSGTYLFPHVFGEFRSLCPDVELKIVELGSVSILQMLEQGKLDIGFTIIREAIPGMVTLPVIKCEIKACLAIGNPLSSLPQIPMPMLRDQPFILLKEDTYNRRIILEECKKYGFIPNIVFSTRQIQTIINLVEQGVGISFLLDVVADKQRGIVSRSLAAPILLQTGLAWREGLYLTKPLQEFIDFIKKAFPAGKI